MFLLVVGLSFAQGNMVYAAAEQTVQTVQSVQESPAEEPQESQPQGQAESSAGEQESQSQDQTESSAGEQESQPQDQTEGSAGEQESPAEETPEVPSEGAAEVPSEGATQNPSEGAAENPSEGAAENPEEKMPENPEEEEKEEPEIINGIITLSVQNGEDIAYKLDLALRTARDHATDQQPVTVKVPQGEYQLGSNLHIFSNTILDVRGVTLRCICLQKNMLMSGTNGAYNGYDDYNRSEACRGYNGFRNITVLGGTWIGNEESTSTLIRLEHASNVTLDGVTLQGGGCLHQSEVAAINGFYVRNCTFKDLKDQNTSSRQEALQLDIPCSEAVFKAVYLDGTVMKNVEITGCTFSNVPRGVGTHTTVIGAYHENIRISGNTFRNVIQEAIVGLNYYNCEITNNTIENCGAGISFQYIKNNYASVYTTIFDGQVPYSGVIRYDAKTVISGNRISTGYSSRSDTAEGIRIYGRNITGAVAGTDTNLIPAQDYYISGVTVTNNVITTAGHGIHLLDARNCVISGNEISGSNVSPDDPRNKNYDGIFVEKGAGDGKDHIVIESNIITEMPRNGIKVQSGAWADRVGKNHISGVGQNGIYFNSKSGCTGQVADNIISGCTDSAIMVGAYSKTGDITGNQLKAASDGYASGYGIYVYDHSAVNGSITKNSIQKTKKASILVSTGSSVSKQISSNEISASDQHGIYVYSSGTVKGNVEKNKIGKTKGNGIYISGKSTVKGGILANTITSAGGKGIYIYDSKKNASVGSIKNNTIKSSKSQGINLSAIGNSLTISGNKLSGNSDHGILVQPGTTKYTVTIKDNTISTNKNKSAVRVTSGKISIKNNSISNAAYGIYASKGVKGNIYYNKFGTKTAVQLRIDRLCRKQTTAAKISSVKSSAKKKLTVKWKKVSKISGYEIQYSTKKDFSSDVKTKTAKSSSTSLTLTGLKSKKTYYVRIRSYYTTGNIKIYSNYTAAKSVKVK